MKRCNKSLILILILVVIFALTGCNSIMFRTFKDNDEPDNKVEEVENNKDDEDVTDKDKDDSEDSDETDSGEEGPAPTVIQPTNNVELLIYVVNSATELDPVTALVPADQEITPQLIVDTVVDSMADQSLIIGVESVDAEGDTVIISFYGDKPPISNVGAGLEDAILNAIAQSITDNLEEYPKIIYRIEGGPYVSGHIELDLNEVYFDAQ